MWRAISAILILLVPAVPLVAGELPPDLEQVRVETVRRLGRLYGMDEESLREPIDVTRADPGDDAFRPWRGIPPYAAGAALEEAGALIIVPSRTGEYPFGDEGQTLRHELSHVLLYRALGFRPPRWFDEGLAMRAGGEWGVEDEWYLAFALPRAARGEYALARVEADFREGETRVRRSYVLARAFTGDLFREEGDLAQFVREARLAGSVEGAFRSRFGADPETAFRRWARERPLWREWVLVLGSSRAVWTAGAFLFLAASLLAFIRRRRSYARLPG
jgi:hypothetical protein